MVIDYCTHYLPKNVNIKKNQSIYDYYDILEEIGTGSFGVVHRCVEKATGNVFAAKFVPTFGGEKQKEIIRNEIKTMSELRHPSLISLHEAFEMDQEMIMIYEFISGDELLEKISKDEKMNENKAKDYIKQICEAIKYINELSYVHLDLKPENIIFTTKLSNKLKINDFSMTTKLNPGKTVKVTTTNKEFSAPELLNGQEIGFNTDMWNIGIITKLIISLNDQKENISLLAKDFINKLLINDKQKRMNIFEALEHPWLNNNIKDLNEEEIIINKKSFYKERDYIRRKYDAWPEPRLSLGRIAQFSSLSKLYSKRYGINDRIFDKEDGLPYFVIRPKSIIQAIEGQSCTFFYKIFSPVPFKQSWWKDGKDLNISINNNFGKYCQQINGNDRALIIKELKNEDQGEYLVRAENEFGKRECISIINLIKDRNISKNQSPNNQLIKIKEEISSSSSSNLIEKGPPHFTFLLRPRFIQKNHNCKLICTVTSDPPAKIKWIKDEKPIDEQKTQISFKSGVASLEIFNIKIEDSGIYTCIATNEFGSDKTSSLITVETKHSSFSSSTNKTTTTSNSLDNASSFLMTGLVGERRNKLLKK